MSKNKIDDYWTLRALEYEQQAYDEATEHLKKINNAYLEAQIYLMDQADQIYRRYFNGQVSEDDANKILNSTISASEMVALKSLASTVQDRESKKAINEFLSRLAAKSRITRLDEWKLKAYISAKAAGATEKAENLKLYSEVVKQAWEQADKEGIVYQTGKELELPKNGKSISKELELSLTNSKGEKVTNVKAQKDQPIKEVKEIPADYVEKVANRKWSGRNYSQRIWNNTDQLANHLGELFTAKEMAGMSETDLANKIANEFQTSMFNSKRLIRTEAAHLVNQAKIDRWKAREVKYYRYVAVLDNRTSRICRSLNEKIFEVAKAQIGKNFPPMHPFCRSVASIFQLIMKIGSQNKHIRGTKEYNDVVKAAHNPDSKRYGMLPSYFTISLEELAEIVYRESSPEKISQRFFYIDAGKKIGMYSWAKNNKFYTTSRIKVHMAKDGRYHCVPAQPKDWNGDKNGKDVKIE